MKVKELLKLLEGVNPEAEVQMYEDGSVFPIDVQETIDHNDYGIDLATVPEYQLVCGEWT